MIVVVGVASGCKPTINKCANQTLFVSVTLDAIAATADTLSITVIVDSGAPKQTVVAHMPKRASGGVQIEFPAGYPKGHLVSVTIDAKLAGAIVGSGSKSLTLAGSCDALSLAVMSASVSGDGPIADGSVDLASNVDLIGADLFGADLSAAQSDAATPDDLTDVVDLVTPAPPDFTMVDLVGCIPTTENCFNNTDDDCDGLIDCADPDCTGGATPKAFCAPDPKTFTVGTTVTGASTACPTGWGTATPINASIQLACGNTCGTCNAPHSSCSVNIENNGSDVLCQTNPGGWTAGETCFPGENVMINGAHTIDAPVWQGDCGSPSGGSTTTKVTPTWATSDRFCSGSAVGGGCSGGAICVAAAPNHCVMKTGLKGANACPTGYVARAAQYYKSFDDSLRTCVCDCGNPTSPGSCSGTPVVSMYDTVGCTGNLVTVPLGCSSNDLSNYHYPILSGVTATPPAAGCNVSVTSNGDPSTNPETVCCTN